MKIAFVLDDTLDSSDGVQQYVLLVGTWMATRGHEVHYIVGETKRTDIANVHSISKNINVRFNKNRLSIPLPADKKRIQNILKKHTYDVIHVQMPFSPFLGSRVIRAAASTAAIIATYHIAPHSGLVTIANKGLGTLQKATYRHIDVMLSVSSVAQAFASQTTGLSSRIIPNAINSMLWAPPSKKARSIDIIFLGRLVERKGCIFLLQALSALKARNKLNAKSVVIAGDGPDRQSLETYVFDHNLSDIVTFVGYVSEKKKKDLLNSSKLAVFPSTGGESFGIVLLEAMAAGAVVIAGDNPGYASVIGAAEGSLVSPYDTKRFAKIIESLVDDNTKRSQLGSRQRRLLDQYNIDTVGSDILTVYKEVLTRKGLHNVKR